jgi:hypothetical protein
MTLTTRTSRRVINAGLLLLILASLFVHPGAALADDNNEASLPTFMDFSNSVQNGQASVLRGVYTRDVLALPVVQQPSDSPAYVSSYDGLVTQFGMAAQYGTVGLLAHNHLAGRSFSGLAVGQEVRLVYGDGHVERFVITEVLEYQALQPTSPYSSFRDLASDEVLSAQQMFQRVYQGERHITFQTCIDAEGNSSWGRLFVIAVPDPQHLNYDRLDRQTWH